MNGNLGVSQCFQVCGVLVVSMLDVSKILESSLKVSGGATTELWG